MRWLGVVLVLCGFVLQQFACCANCCAPGETSSPTAVAKVTPEAAATVRAHHRCQHAHHQPQASQHPRLPTESSHDDHGEHHLCVSSHLFFVLRPADGDLTNPWMVTVAWITVLQDFDLRTLQPAAEVSLSQVRSPHPLAERSRLGHWLI